MAKLPTHYKIHDDGLTFKLEPIYEELVPVVRCKDCGYCVVYKETNGDGTYLGCTRTWGVRGALDPNDFCSYGERRADNDR